MKVVTLGNLELTKLFHKQDELPTSLRSTIIANVVDQLAHLELAPHVLCRTKGSGGGRGNGRWQVNARHDGHVGLNLRLSNGGGYIHASVRVPGGRR